jgi:predicted thioesterase
LLQSIREGRSNELVAAVHDLCRHRIFFASSDQVVAHVLYATHFFARERGFDLARTISNANLGCRSSKRAAECREIARGLLSESCAPIHKPIASPALRTNEGELAVGASATASATVTEADLADKVVFGPGDVFPAVYATSRMVALMEVAAARVMRPFLAPGEHSVGVTVDIEHTAPTPPGARVSAEARFLGREGKLYLFEVIAHDESGIIGKGRHKRAIVDTQRLQARAEERRGKPPSSPTA